MYNDHSLFTSCTHMKPIDLVAVYNVLDCRDELKRGNGVKEGEGTSQCFV